MSLFFMARIIFQTNIIIVYILVKGFYSMRNKRAITAITVSAVIMDVIRSVLTDNVESVRMQHAFENRELKNLFIVVGVFPNLSGKEDVINHYQVSMIGNPSQYPIDIVEIVHKTSGLWLRFSGIEIPMILNPDMIITDQPAINAILNLIIDTNPMLLDALGESGGHNGTKKSRK